MARFTGGLAMVRDWCPLPYYHPSNSSDHGKTESAVSARVSPVVPKSKQAKANREVVPEMCYPRHERPDGCDHMIRYDHLDSGTIWTQSVDRLANNSRKTNRPCLDPVNTMARMLEWRYDTQSS